MKLLHIDSSPLAANSVSRELTRRSRRPVARQPSRHHGRIPRPGGRRADPPQHGFAGLPPRPDAEPDRSAEARERHVREAGQPVPRRRRDRRRRADVQLLGPEPAQGLDRPHRASRPHLQVHREGPAGPGRRQDGDRRLHAAAASTRPAGAGRPGPPGELPEDGVRLLRHHRRALRARRRRGDGRGGEGGRAGAAEADIRVSFSEPAVENIANTSRLEPEPVHQLS